VKKEVKQWKVLHGKYQTDPKGAFSFEVQVGQMGSNSRCLVLTPLKGGVACHRKQIFIGEVHWRELFGKRSGLVQKILQEAVGGEKE